MSKESSRIVHIWDRLLFQGLRSSPLSVIMCFFMSYRYRLYKKCTISRSFSIVSVWFLHLPSFSFPCVIVATFSYPFPRCTISADCSSYTNIKLLGYLSPLCWISSTERKVFSQQVITNKQSRIAAEQETSLKLENWGLAGKFASYCTCDFQLTTLLYLQKLLNLFRD